MRGREGGRVSERERERAVRSVGSKKTSARLPTKC